jgi:V/A-type H+/Na+-transporting ATPase subunit C
MARIDHQYIYSLGRVKELEKGLLAASTLDRLLESDEPLSLLRSIGFFRASEDYDENTAIVDIFRRERAHNRAMLHDLIADSPLEDIFLLPYDIQNLKLLLKGRLTGNGAGKDGALETGKYPAQMLIDLVYDDIAADLPPAVVADVRALIENWPNHPQLARIDSVLDRRLRAWQFEIARAGRNAFLLAYLARLSDVQNLSVIIRRKTHEIGRDGLRGVLLDGGTLDYAMLEKLVDFGWESILTAVKPTDHGGWMAEAVSQLERSNFLTIVDTCGARYLRECLRTARQHTFGIEQILAFFIIRDLELKVVRTLWMGKRFGCEPAKLSLRNRLI